MLGRVTCENQTSSQNELGARGHDPKLVWRGRGGIRRNGRDGTEPRKEAGGARGCYGC